MNVPEIDKMLGIFPVKYATYLISLFALGIGGCGLTGIILYGLVENSIISHDLGDIKADNPLKKAVIIVIGFSSLLLFCSGVVLFLGGALNMRGSIELGVWIIFIMCMVLLSVAIGAPVSCFFLPNTCLIKRVSSAVMVMGNLTLMLFVILWMYFMVVVHNYVDQM